MLPLKQKKILTVNTFSSQYQDLERYPGRSAYQCYTVCSWLDFYYTKTCFRKLKTNEEYFLHMACFWWMKSVMCKCGCCCGVGLWTRPCCPFPSACKAMPSSIGKSTFCLIDFAQVLMQGPNLFFPGKFPSQCHHLL